MQLRDTRMGHLPKQARQNPSRRPASRSVHHDRSTDVLQLPKADAGKQAVVIFLMKGESHR